MEIRVRAPQGQFLLENPGRRRRADGRDTGYDLATLDLGGNRCALIADVPGITDVQTSLEAGIPSRRSAIEPRQGRRSGPEHSRRDSASADRGGRFQGRRVSTGGNSYRILVQLKDAEQRSLDEILDLTLTTASGERVALRNVVTSEASRGPILIDRKDQQRR
jgi:HAE1 family hydrophobic/amphiphilic exporter-1